MLKVRDRRYKTVANLIKGGYMPRWLDIFQVIPKTVVAGDLGMNNMRFSRLMNHVHQFTLAEIHTMADLFEITPTDMIDYLLKHHKECVGTTKETSKNRAPDPPDQSPML